MLQIRLLGQFDVRMDGKRVVISSRAGQSLFAYLVLNAGIAHRREKLAGIFWPDTSDESARKNLRQELWRIRKAIPTNPLTTVQEYLVADEFTLKINRDADYWLDAAILEKPDLDPQSLTSNLSLYQGELLPGFYEDWVILERERIQTIFESKMEQLVDQLVDAERWTAVQEHCDRWLALGHAPEPAYRALMISYSARGDMAKVSATYQRCVDDLHDQFGVETSVETSALYNGLLKGAKAPRRMLFAQQSGTVTFLFSDIEGSTLLLDKLGDQYATSLAEHHQILRAAIQKWNGSEMDTQGDAFFVTFARALDAVRCAAEAQLAFHRHPWPLQEPLRVRMGLHTGEPLIASTGYVGMDVHRAARIGDAGYGGQVLMSQSTRELVIHDLPQGLSIRDLGEHRLKDLKSPTSIYQLKVDGLPDEFPPLKTRFTGTEEPAPGEAPFKGLQYFDEMDADLFFGRERLTTKLVNRLQDTQFLSVIIGASGSGKSSLVRAGLIPALKKGVTLPDGTKLPEGSAEWRIHTLTPTAHPLEALATELTRDSESVTAAATLMDDLTKDPRSLSLFFARKNHKPHTLLVVDQFEELFTLCHDEFEREAFVDNLLSTFSPASSDGDSRGNVTLILTLRADFYAHLAQYPELRDAVAQQQEYIGPMTAEELRFAIEEPARRGHWVFEPGLVDLILRDVGDEPGALPLLSHALLETWKRRAGYTLTLKGYADAGGVRGAIAHSAESVYQNFSSEEQAIARSIFLRLTELGEGTEDTRRRVPFEELMSSSASAVLIRKVLNRLADVRLVTLSEESAEVAHEALIREWPTLREWLNQDRESLHLHRDLTEAAQDWLELNRETDYLYRGARLAQAREWAANHANDLNTLENEFLETSLAWAEHETAEKEQQRQRELDAAQKLAEAEKQRAEVQAHAARQLRKRALYLAGALAIALGMALTALGLGAQARQSARIAQDQQRIASSRELAGAAISNLDADPERSILLALQAVTTTYSVNKTWTTEAEDALHRALQASRLELTLTGHAGVVVGIAYSPDGKRLATASDDGTAKIWDAATGQELLTLSINDGSGRHGLAFSPDGNRLAVSSSGVTITIWDSITGQEILILRGHTDKISNVAFSPDGKRLASASEDRTAKIWDAETGQEIITISGHAGPVYDVNFSPDGSLVATTSQDGTAKLWDAATGQEIVSLNNHQGEVYTVVFSPDSKQLATASLDGTAKIWDAATGQEILSLHGHTDWVTSVAFSSDGLRLATASFDQKVKLWDASTGQELFTLVGHTGPVLRIIFSPDGAHLASSSFDGTVKVWNAALNRELLTLNFPESHATASSPDGARLATGYLDGTVRLWKVSTGLNTGAPAPRETQRLSGHTGAVNWLVYSSDGSRLASASDDQTVKVWDPGDGKELLTLHGHTAGVTFAAFNLDGSLLATASSDYTVKVWDLARTGEQAVLTLLIRPESTAVAFSPDGIHLATGMGDGLVKLWDISDLPDSGEGTGKEILTLRGHSDEIRSITFSPDGIFLVTASQDGTARVWDTVTGREIFTLQGQIGGISGAAYSQDGANLATSSSDGTVKIWDPISGRERITLRSEGDELSAVAITQDGSLLITASSGGVLRYYLLRMEDLLDMARTRVTRTLNSAECQQFLHISKERCDQEYGPVISTAANTSSPEIVQSNSRKPKVCQVADNSGGEQFFSQIAYQGAQESAERFGWESIFLESQQPADIEQILTQFISQDCELIIIPSGFSMAEQVKAAAEANPDQKFQIMESLYDSPPGNVWQQWYAVDQAGFLAGYAAASVTKTGKVGIYGGIHFPPVTDIMDGFAWGVLYYNQKNGTNIAVLGWDVEKQDGLFIGNFSSLADGRQMGQMLLDDGADIILPVAGSAGLGTAAVIQERGGAYLIGVDRDWALHYPEYADIILTSIEKRLDVSVISAVQSIVDGTFTSGTHHGTLETGEVGIAPFNSLEELISEQVKAELEQIRQDIQAGIIHTR